LIIPNRYGGSWFIRSAKRIVNTLFMICSSLNYRQVPEKPTVER
jgi:hypothetical protein